MSVSEEDVRRVARLAGLELDDEQVCRYRDQLGEILEYVERLRAVETDVDPESTLDSVRPTDSSNDAAQPERGSLDRERLLDEAPSAEEGYLRVPAEGREE